MPIKLSEIPVGAHQLIASSIMRLGSAKGGAVGVGSVTDASKLKCSLGHQVYSASAEDIAAGKQLDEAVLTAWEFIILDGNQPIASVELACDADGGNLRFASISSNRFVGATVSAIRMAESRDEIQKGDFELRVVRAPSIYVVALWLKDLTATNDVLIPLTPSNSAVASKAAVMNTMGGATSLTNHPGLSRTEFFNALMPVAKESMTFDSAPPPGAPSGGAPLVLALDSSAARFHFNRAAFLTNYPILVDRTWEDPAFLEEVLANPVSALSAAGIATIPGAIVRTVQIKVAGRSEYVERLSELADEWAMGQRSGSYNLWLPMRPEGDE